MTKVTLLGGGDAMYIYPNIHENKRAAELLAIQEAVIDVAYPGDETIVTTIDEARLPEIVAQMTEHGTTIVDTREGTT